MKTITFATTYVWYLNGPVSSVQSSFQSPQCLATVWPSWCEWCPPVYLSNEPMMSECVLCVFSLASCVQQWAIKFTDNACKICVKINKKNSLLWERHTKKKLTRLFECIPASYPVIKNKWWLSEKWWIHSIYSLYSLNFYGCWSSLK